MVPVFDVGRIIVFAKALLIGAAIWMAFKIFIIGVATVLIPIAVYKGLEMMTEQSLDLINDQMTSPQWSANLVEFTGLAAWLADTLKFQACFQLLASFVVARFMLTLIKKGS